MKTRSRAGYGLAACSAVAVLLAGCDKPEWVTRLGPTPALPDWAQPFNGRRLETVFPLASAQACIGNAEQVEARYEGGGKLTGWGWDVSGKAPLARVLITDNERMIRGAGESGMDRTDVPQAVPSVTSSKVGWWAVTAMQGKPVDAWGLTADGRACSLGRVGP